MTNHEHSELHIPPELADAMRALRPELRKKLSLRDIDDMTKPFRKRIAALEACLAETQTRNGGNLAKLEKAQARIAELDDEIDAAKDKMHKLRSWAQAYPISIFPEPDFKRAAAVLKDAGMTLDAISASNMRHVTQGIVRIIGEETDD